ncbi:Glycosyltransferase, GT2 family [Streptococcus equinus]|nr:Glycosyltransferase, GT2 family [Streptococcus equinus]
MLNVLIVVYNKEVWNSVSFKFIDRYKDKLNLIIFDNSTKNFGNKEYCVKQAITYYSVGKNIGLSKAYNYVLDRLDLEKDNYLLILDDDTTLNSNYMEEIFSDIKNDSFDILLPKVNSNGQMISPSKLLFDCRVVEIKDWNNVDFEKITGINSGMVIRCSVYKNIRYNENIFLDYVDHEFMRKIRKEKYNVQIMKSVINQDFSRNKIESIDSVKFRFSIYKKDFKLYCQICRRRWFYYVNITKLRLVHLFRYKKIF